jgi:hypothetical protein
MTSLDSVAVSTLTPAVHGDAVVTEALHFAVRRDLARLALVLATPVTAVRRAALIDHTRFMIDQLKAHHHALEAVSWPAVLTRRPELEDAAGRVALAHAELAGPIGAMRNASLEWRADPERRLTLLSAVRELLVALPPVLDEDYALAPVIDDALRAGSSAVQQRTAAWWVAPTRQARRMFWLLDDLEPRQAAQLTARTPRAVMWILRNGFSGAYNRSAYLMWVGGGTGPAV